MVVVRKRNSEIRLQFDKEKDDFIIGVKRNGKNRRKSDKDYCF